MADGQLHEDEAGCSYADASTCASSQWQRDLQRRQPWKQLYVDHTDRKRAWIRLACCATCASC
jgi:hypothetical protein